MVRRPVNIGLAGALFLLMACALTAAAVPGQWKFYTANSYWRSLVQQAPVDPNSDYYIAHLKTLHADQSLQLSGITGTYGFQLYYGTATDPVWTITSTYGSQQPYIFHGPANMTPSPGDGELACIDTTQDGGNGVVFEFGSISLNSGARTGTAGFGGKAYLKSNGLEGTAALSNEKRNQGGHRGLGTMVYGYILSEVKAQDIPHVMKILIPKTGKSPFAPYLSHVWPYIGGEGNSGDIPEGARMRLKASVQPKIDALANPYVKAMAQALLTYGATVADIGGSSSIAVMVQTGGTSIADWAALGITTRGAMNMFTVDDFEFVQLGWVPPGT